MRSQLLIMVLSLASLAVALSFTQTNFTPQDAKITTYTPIRATIKRMIRDIRTPKPVMAVTPDLRTFSKQETQPAHEVARDLATYGSIQMGLVESSTPAVGIPVYQPADQLDANDFHFSMSYKFEF